MLCSVTGLVFQANIFAVEIGAELLASNSLWQDELDRAQDMRKSSCHST